MTHLLEVAAMKTHVAVQGRNVFELPMAKITLHRLGVLLLGLLLLLLLWLLLLFRCSRAAGDSAALDLPVAASIRLVAASNTRVLQHTCQPTLKTVLELWAMLL